MSHPLHLSAPPRAPAQVLAQLRLLVEPREALRGRDVVLPLRSRRRGNWSIGASVPRPLVNLRPYAPLLHDVLEGQVWGAGALSQLFRQAHGTGSGAAHRTCFRTTQRKWYGPKVPPDLRSARSLMGDRPELSARASTSLAYCLSSEFPSHRSMTEMFCTVDDVELVPALTSSVLFRSTTRSLMVRRGVVAFEPPLLAAFCSIDSVPKKSLMSIYFKNRLCRGVGWREPRSFGVIVGRIRGE